jgi:hypothetical protein
MDSIFLQKTSRYTKFPPEFFRDDSLFTIQLLVKDDTDNVTRFMMLAREPIIPRTDKPFKVLDDGNIQSLNDPLFW